MSYPRGSFDEPRPQAMTPAPGEERVEEIRVKCAAASYLDGPEYEDMEYLLTRLRTVEEQKGNLQTLLGLRTWKLAHAEQRVAALQADWEAYLSEPHDVFVALRERVAGLQAVLDAMWGEGQAVRDAIVKHYGTRHPAAITQSRVAGLVEGEGK